MSLATYFVPLAVALTGAFAIEAAASPQHPSLRPGDLAIRAAGYALITLFWFQFSWRPWLAASSCLLTLAILSVVDRLKRRVIGEPVVFSDLALLAQVPRHPQLYYTLPLTDLRIAGPLLLAVATVVSWYVVEPAALPSGAGASILAILGLPVALAALALAGLTPLGQRALRRIFPHPDLARDVARYGLVAPMMGYALRRLGEDDARPVLARGEGSPDDEIVVVVQLESFLDPARLGGPDLPAMARIRAQAAQYGRLAVPAHGAYTMRSEHAVLTGLDPESLGFGRYDPYLARKGEEPTSLARLARAAGFETVFVHPFHRDFFDRARVFQRLGFERLVMEEDFAGTPRIGPYIGDVAVADRILAEVAERQGSTGGRTFVFSVTMENHGPWKPGRLTGIDEPLAQYLHHVAHTGQAIERLIEGLAGRRATLCVFGDHAPSLPDLRPPEFGPMATDYALFRFGRDGGSPPARVDLTAAQLGCVLRDAVTPKR
ncbi:LTA synthase family protein [Methylorubrum extorquens]|uniref:LTA synthase family protein n=1 Tax=Methylorubrum extorquens TaxID=408 RepID=UPI001EE4EF8F|nr:LTA synthase family protein [Methylorubrum extorquens]MCG5245226.1 LTA synthase family protein [Methylorubrum extorquens]